MEEKTREELIASIEKLKAKNSSLSDAVTQMKVKLAKYEDDGQDQDEPKSKRTKKMKKKEKVFEKRKIAIKFSYEGNDLSKTFVTPSDEIVLYLYKC